MTSKYQQAENFDFGQINVAERTLQIMDKT